MKTKNILIVTMMFAVMVYYSTTATYKEINLGNNIALLSSTR